MVSLEGDQRDRGRHGADLQDLQKRREMESEGGANLRGNGEEREIEKDSDSIMGLGNGSAQLVSKGLMVKWAILPNLIGTSTMAQSPKCRGKRCQSEPNKEEIGPSKNRNLAKEPGLIQDDPSFNLLNLQEEISMAMKEAMTTQWNDWFQKGKSSGTTDKSRAIVEEENTSIVESGARNHTSP